MLTTQFEGTNCLLSVAEPDKWKALENVSVTAFPEDHIASVEQFLNHWQPDVLLWADPVMRPRLLQSYANTKKPMFLIDLFSVDVSRRGARRAISSILSQFEKAQVTSDTAARQLAGLGFASEKTKRVPPISCIAWPLPDDESHRRKASAVIGPRPIWCAAHIHMSELSTISNAHHQARKSFPTAVLILVPSDSKDVKEMLRILSADGWRVDLDGAETRSDQQCEVIITNGPVNLGVWYRLASVSIMGGSLNGPTSSDPFKAAALGSAVISGPVTFPHAARYEQLSKGGAVVQAEDILQIGTVLTATLAPDRSAELATAAWDVSSEGIEALTHITELVSSVFPSEEP